MIELGLIILISLCVILLLFFLSGLKIVDQYEIGVTFTLGKYVGSKNPGLHLIVPIFQKIIKVDMRQKVINLPEQEVMTKDQVNLSIDGVVFYSVVDAKKLILNVEEIEPQLIAKATSELKEILGDKSMKQCLSDREDIAKRLKTKLQNAIKDEQAVGEKDTGWGLDLRDVQINNINLPKELTRAMAKGAEASQEKDARVTKAEGELLASQKLQQAASQFRGNPNAMRLRELQTYQEIGTEQNTLMLVIPSDMNASAVASSILATEGLRQKNYFIKKKAKRK